MKNSFPHLLRYHFYNYLFNVKKERQISNEQNISKSFIEHLRDIIEKVKIMKNKEIEDKLKELNSSENISEIKSKFKNIINDIKDNFFTENLNFGISEEDFDEDDDIDNENEKEDNYDFSSFKACDIIKIMYIS